MLPFILWYSYYIICAVSSFSFLYMWKTFQKMEDCKRINMSMVYFHSLIQINLFISVASINIYPALITRKCGPIENRICFIKDLLVARDQLPSNIAVTYFPYSFLCGISQRSVHTTQKQNVSKYDRILFTFFVCVILNNTGLSER